MRAAEKAGYSVLILNSITHGGAVLAGAWNFVDDIARSKYKGNSWSAWNDITPRHRAFLDVLMQSPLHIIATMRSKTETAQVGENGHQARCKTRDERPNKRDGAEYEFTVVLTSCMTAIMQPPARIVQGYSVATQGPSLPRLVKTIVAWLNSGRAAEAQPPKEDSDPGRSTPYRWRNGSRCAGSRRHDYSSTSIS